MRRAITLAVAAGLCALVVLAAIDALREDGSGTNAPGAAATRLETQPASRQRSLAESLRRHGATGVLYLSPEGCESAEPARLRAIRLPGLEPVEGPEYHACSFSLSPDGEVVAAGNSVWQPQGSILAGSGSGTIELSSREPVWGVSLDGSGARVQARRDADAGPKGRGRRVDDGLQRGRGDHLPRRGRAWPLDARTRF